MINIRTGKQVYLTIPKFFISNNYINHSNSKGIRKRLILLLRVNVTDIKGYLELIKDICNFITSKPLSTIKQ